MNKSKLILFASTVFVFVSGVFAFRAGYFLTIGNHGRTPAAIENIFDLSQLQGDALEVATKDRIILGTKVVQLEDSVGLELGHFYIKDPNGRIVSGCELYPELEIRFAAGDMAVNGTPPQMILTGRCQQTSNENVISALFVDKDTISIEKVIDRKFSSIGDSSTTVSFHNVSDSWPLLWIVQSVRLYGKDKEMLIEAKDYRRLLGKTIELNWQQGP